MSKQPHKRASRKSSSTTTRAVTVPTLTTTGVRPAAPAADEYSEAREKDILDLLRRMRAHKDKQTAYTESFEPRDEYDLRLLKHIWAEGLSYVRYRNGRYWFLSQAGLRKLEAAEGQTHQTQIRCWSNDVLLAKKFQSAARARTNAELELPHVVHLWAETLDFDTYAALRGIGVELGLPAEDAAAGALRRLVANLNVHNLPPSPFRDRLLRDVFGERA